MNILHLIRLNNEEEALTSAASCAAALWLALMDADDNLPPHMVAQLREIHAEAMAHEARCRDAVYGRVR